MASRWPDDIVLSAKCIPDCVPIRNLLSVKIHFLNVFIFNIFGLI